MIDSGFAGRIVVSRVTHVGRREENEDDYIVAPELGLFVVCDGMGGHASGEIASSLAVQAIHETFEANTEGTKRGRGVRVPDTKATLRKAMVKANSRIRAKGRAKAHQGMGTTAVALALDSPTRGVVGWVGDSRCYRLRGPRLEQLTKDHSLVNLFLERGELKPEDVDDFPAPGTLVRCLGHDAGESGDLREIDLCAGDVFLLCSDGLTDALDEAVIRAVLYEGRGAQALVDLAILMEREHQDNVTAVVVKV